MRFKELCNTIKKNIAHKGGGIAVSRARWKDDGKFNGHSTFSLEEVLKIRELFREKLRTARELASDHGVGIETIRRILRRDTFPEGHVTGLQDEGLELAARESQARLQELLDTPPAVAEDTKEVEEWRKSIQKPY